MPKLDDMRPVGQRFLDMLAEVAMASDAAIRPGPLRARSVASTQLHHWNGRCRTHIRPDTNGAETMTLSLNPLFASEVVDCMAEDRVATPAEVVSVAERIWSDGAPNRSAFAWSELAPGDVTKVGAMRSACVALGGTQADLAVGMKD